MLDASPQANFLVEELQASESFRAWFITQLPSSFVFPSKSEVRLEKSPARLQDARQTDVRIGWFDEAGELKACALIETKVTADFGPGQVEAYEDELAACRSELGGDHAAIVLVAPAAKLATLKHDARFCAVISVEQVVESLRLRRADPGLHEEVCARLAVRIALLEAICGKRASGGWTAVTIVEKRRFADTIELSASDLVGHLNCRHLTGLDLAVANGLLARPKVWDPLADILRERGARHEAEYVEHLRGLGLQVTVIEGRGVDDGAVDQTLQAMRAGAEIIVQAALRADGWSGRADVLRKVAAPSELGDWSYEVTDAKLARETKGGTVLQLCLYSDLVAGVQGLTPEFMHVVAPWTDFQPQTYRTADFGAYYRRARAALQQALAGGEDEYPDPKEHCEICRWRTRCEAKRRADDHLCLVAGITKVQITELQGREVQTMAELAASPLPLPWKPDRASAKSFERVREHGLALGSP